MEDNMSLNAEIKISEDFSYLEREEFTSEIFKIEIRNLGIFGIGELKKLLRNQFSLDASKIKSPRRRDFAYVCFRTQEDQESALKKLNGFKWKGKILSVSPAKAAPDPLARKRREENSCPGLSKRRKTCLEATCPLGHLKYEEQVTKKKIEMEELLKVFGCELKKLNPQAKNLCFKSNSMDMPCEFLGLKLSPQVDGYRNKTEFAVGKNAEGSIVVGFRLGSYADGSVEVGSLEGLPHISEKVKLAAKTFEEFIISSKYKIFNPENNSGHFKQLGVRNSVTSGEIMLIIGVYSGNLNNEEIEGLKNEVTDFYRSYDENIFKCDSLYYQDLNRRDAGQMMNPVDHLLGKTYITDEIHSLKFRISPLAFFQINTKGAGILYEKVIELARPTKNTIVLDICCGTGTIGLCFAKHCKKVLGVEIIPDAVKDAEYNAKENNIKNCKFFTGNSDDYIQTMVRETYYENVEKNELDIVAIVDPPRAGLHNRSILALRSAHGLNRLVYISCNPKSAQRNWLDLARPESKSYKGQPFFPKLAVAVDMFPHTAHTEMVVLFERVTVNDQNLI
ncbi:tRNA (uracil-5-)-methyltransferase homolog A [Condylostylus longicornis]|uniref:tRNA (uracil-5-)-methyltransferase homolog A n=1 Tax=Condylostylus longicornis TaxID=2530218 RepID=UPI00244E0237|nr:tRNA (uracil-5-)-methyltransferase homolog A [Condylostylus longicornis]